MEAILCDEIYERPSGYSIRCTFIKDHPGARHSWNAVQAQDEADAEAAKIVQETMDHGWIGSDDTTPEDVRALLTAITAGNADPYLEAILAVTHNRKRTLRGTRGFRNL